MVGLAGATRDSDTEGKTVRQTLASPLVLLVSLSLGGLAWPMTTLADSVTQVFGDDFNTSTTNALASPGQAAAITTSMNNFVTANPANGSGPSGQSWSYTWAPAAAVAKVEAGITVLNYSPFVVNVTAATDAAGNKYPVVGPAELGGALINLKYTPQVGAPAFTSLHWIQAYSGTIYGKAFGPILDNNPAGPYSSQSNVSPFYDTVYAAGTLGGGGGYFLDRPRVPENEYEMNPVVASNFSVVLADDVQTMVGKIIQNTVTLYGGESWGFTYTAADVPEPSSILLMMIGGGGAFAFRKIGARRVAA